ncbi:EamA family transporter [Nocardioides sp. JQ2195]|uniref:EamA family transporter n=1 Tax=Nocardioides sp. JQ2195 TaxID=2592334 RepID=UPI00143E5F24|nr:EamA family transporter [Nocardioides sp. JQ2195]QIX26105.1 EamA family transporter [Nocardioides sp. JQ2195]
MSSVDDMLRAYDQFDDVGRVMRRAIWLVLGGILSVQFGAAVAKDLFDRIGPTEMVFLRLVTSTLVFLAIARPSLRGRSRDDWLVVVGFGLSLGVMNWSIYEAFSRIPLGLAVTIEFVGPLAIAVVGFRRARDLVWVGFAAAGVVLLGFQPAGVTVAGVLFALLAGAGWGSYILMSASTGARWPGIDGLAVASAVATFLLLPAVLAGQRDLLLDPEILAYGAAVGLLSSVIPYSLELMALRSLKPSVFGILMSLEPAAAALAAIIVLGEFLEPLQWLAMGLVIIASVGATRSGSTIHEPVPD